MANTRDKTHTILIDPDDLNNIDIPDHFDHDAATSFVDHRILQLAKLLGKQAAGDFLKLEAANDNKPPKTGTKRQKGKS